MKRILVLLVITACFLALGAFGSPDPAQAKDKFTLKAVSFQGKNVCFVDALFIFQKRLEEASAGKIAINYVGGPEAIPAFEQIEAVKNGLVDLALIPAAYYVPQLPLADAVKLSRINAWEERETGAYDFFNKLTQEKVNAYYLGRYSNGVQYHIYLNKKIEKPDFTGMKIRVTPVYKPFVEKLGGVTVTTAPGEVYTALERGVVDGYGWPFTRISDLGWHEVTKYIIYPGFYQVDVGILMNLKTWNKLPRDLQDVVISAAKKAEREAADHYAKLVKEEEKLITSKGVQIIRFNPADEKFYLETAYKAGWDQVLAKSPDLGARFKIMLEK